MLVRGQRHPISFAGRFLDDLRHETFRQRRKLAVIGLIADRAGQAGCATLASLVANPRSIRMVLADPSAVIASHAVHQA